MWSNKTFIFMSVGWLRCRSVDSLFCRPSDTCPCCLSCMYHKHVAQFLFHFWSSFFCSRRKNTVAFLIAHNKSICLINPSPIHKKASWPFYCAFRHLDHEGVSLFVDFFCCGSGSEYQFTHLCVACMLCHPVPISPLCSFFSCSHPAMLLLQYILIWEVFQLHEAKMYNQRATMSLFNSLSVKKHRFLMAVYCINTL